ncbi:glycosyltransferase family 4 protein [Microvirga sp. HBU67558]|uniref:glycosyltransferase family 4 protein n=1 Tax=Microvirga TaxID=186650 RepID=UPI001B380CC4|nr:MULTISPECIES: glycosyltransferase family 4 protein [unclassified Microvirga]MBQ0824818.1 glycosyltransferase family 4 protein [Microvirga sp. HBU67558]
MAWPDGGAGLHVLMTADAVGGVWQYALDLSDGLRAHDVKTTIAVLGPPPSADQQVAAEAMGATLVMTGLPLDWTAQAPHEVEEAGEAIARLAARLRPDLIHLNSPALAARAVFDAPVVAVCHSCVATWWQAVKGGRLPEEFVWRTELVRRGYASAGRLLAPTLAFARTTAKVYELPQVPSVVRNGRRLAPLSASMPDGDFVFTAGRLWDEGKNFAGIDRLASRLPIPVLAAGSVRGPNGATAQAVHARVLGQLSDMDVTRYLSAKPIFVSPARYEPFGLAVLEAAQMECALILSDIPTFRELWEDAALFVDPDDESAVVEATERLLRDPETRRALGSAARARSESYTIEAMSAGVLSAYRFLLEPKPSRSPLEGAAA